MQHLFVVFLVLVGVWSFYRLPVWVWLSSLLCAVGLTGCGSMPDPVSHQFTQDRVRAVCWKAPELAPESRYFVIPDGMAVAVSDKNPDFDLVIEANGIVYEYWPYAPAGNLQLLPLSRMDAWCTNIPKPTDAKVLRLLDPCTSITPEDEGQPVAKNLLGQIVTPRSPIFCGKQPRMAFTTQESLSILARNIAYQEAYQHARKTAMALTQAEADMQRVINESSWSLKRLFLEDPGTLEQIQQRVADALNSIEPPPEYGDRILEELALAGFQAGFDDGKFEVEAKLFAIDAGILILEVAALEVAMGPLGGAKLLASAASKGGKALTQAVKRLEDIPIFIPGGANGLGGFVRVGTLINAAKRARQSKLADALNAAGIGRPEGADAHHIVATGHKLAREARDIMIKFGVKLDEAVNGVFLPSNKLSPNPNGAIVHATLANKVEYYERVNKFLKKARSKEDLIRRLQQIRETLQNGKFYDEIF